MSLVLAINIPTRTFTPRLKKAVLLSFDGTNGEEKYATKANNGVL